jgi:hypothetical protein
MVMILKNPKKIIIYITLSFLFCVFSAHANEGSYSIINRDDTSMTLTIEFNGYLKTGTDRACYEAAKIFYGLSQSGYKVMVKGFSPSRVNPVTKEWAEVLVHCMGDPHCIEPIENNQ